MSEPVRESFLLRVRRSRTYPAAAATWWLSDSVGEDKSAVFTYNADSQLATVQRFDGLTTTGNGRGFTEIVFRDDGRIGQLTHRQTSQADPDFIADFKTSYDLDNRVDNRITTLKNVDGSVFLFESTTFDYDDRGQIVTNNTDGATTFNGKYDTRGN